MILEDGMPRVRLAQRAKMSLRFKWELIASILIFSCLVDCLNAQGRMKDYNVQTKSVSDRRFPSISYTLICIS